MGMFLILSCVLSFFIGLGLLWQTRDHHQPSMLVFVLLVVGLCGLMLSMFIPVRTTITKQTKFYKAQTPTQMIVEHDGVLYCFSSAVDYNKYSTLKEVYLREYYNGYNWKIATTVTLDNQE